MYTTPFDLCSASKGNILALMRPPEKACAVTRPLCRIKQEEDSGAYQFWGLKD